MVVKKVLFFSILNPSKREKWIKKYFYNNKIKTRKTGVEPATSDMTGQYSNHWATFSSFVILRILIKLQRKSCYKERSFSIELLLLTQKVLICFEVLTLETNYLVVVLNKLSKEYSWIAIIRISVQKKKKNRIEA